MKYVTFEIENIEPVKQADTIIQKDNEFSKGYITASNIRGAFIANYMKMKSLSSIEGVHRERLLKGGLTFFNAYPICDSKRTLPVPSCYYAEKDNIKTFRYTENMEIKVEDNLNNDKDYDKISEQNFANWNLNNNKLEIVSIDKSSNIHINKGSGKNKIFRYETINAGNIFAGIIGCREDEFADECIEILKEGLFYVGGSKGSGYGLCKLKNYYIQDDNPETHMLKELYPQCDAEEITIVLLSDMAYRDENGAYCSTLTEKYVKEKLGLNEAVLIKSYVDNEYIAGYNNKWGYRLPNIKGIKAGSTFVYRIKGHIDNDILDAFENQGIGERTSEGYGRITVISGLPFKRLQVYHEKNLAKKLHEEMMSEEEKADLSLIVNRIYRGKLQKKISEFVLDLYDSISHGNEIKSSQWQKLMELMNIIEPLDYELGINKVKKYFDNINNKKENRSLGDSFSRINLKNRKIQEYIISELENQERDNFESQYLNPVVIGEVKSSISLQSMYVYKVNIFKELFRLNFGNSRKMEV